MSQYSKKYYEKEDLYDLFIESVVNFGRITYKVLNWLYMNQALKKQ